MSLGKLPVIGWVSSSHSKRRFKTELTPDMISPPLGDFRHTMHVGRGGDAFGDTSFLRNHGGEEAKPNNFFARTLRHVRRSPLRNRGSRSKDEASPLPPAISPIIKNAVSLPQLNEGSYRKDSLGGFAFKSTPNSFSDYGLESGFCTIPRVPRSEKTQENTSFAESALTRSDSLLSFRLDLGPSLMSELLHVIGHSNREEAEGEESQTPASSDIVPPHHLKGSQVEDSLPWRSRSLQANCEDRKAESSFWGHSETDSSLGHSVCTNGDGHSLEFSQEELSCSQGRLPSSELGDDCSMDMKEFSQATPVLSGHYGMGGGYHRGLQQQDESRSQTSWESSNVHTWHLKAGQEHKAEWCQEAEEEEEEEEEEVEEEFYKDGTSSAREGHSSSFEYVDEEEDDEVKV
ncbi:cdc42 effector protein 1 [Pogona vitticeps]